MWFLSSPVPSSAKPGRSVLPSPMQVWVSLPGSSSHCPLQEPGASSWAGCLHPTAQGHRGCCLAKPVGSGWEPLPWDPTVSLCLGHTVTTACIGKIQH